MGKQNFTVAAPFLIGALLVLAALGAGWYAPTERTMGDAQRIVYVHVAMAWLSLLGFLMMAGSGAGYLARRTLAWDHWFQTCGELGWLAGGLTLLTGSLWAHEAWGTWWEWEPRLTASLVLWLIYSGILLVRGSLEDAHQRARVGAVLSVLGAVDVPLVIVATRWFRGLHPAAPQMEPRMRWTLLLNVLAFTALFVWLALRRARQLQLAETLDDLEAERETQRDPQSEPSPYWSKAMGEGRTGTLARLDSDVKGRTPAMRTRQQGGF